MPVNLLPSQDGTRKRPATHTLMKDAEGAYWLQIGNGNVYPLSDQSDPDSDAILRRK